MKTEEHHLLLLLFMSQIIQPFSGNEGLSATAF